MNKLSTVLILVLLMLLLLLIGCIATEESTVQAEPEEEQEEQGITLSEEDLTNYSIYIKLLVDEDGMPTMLNVIEGEYQLRNGMTLWAGSSINYEKDNMTFPKGLLIEVIGGEVELKGVKYADGTRLLVDIEGNLSNID